MASDLDRLAAALFFETQGDQEDMNGNNAPKQEWSELSPDWQDTHRRYARAILTELLSPSMKGLNAAVDATGAGSDMSWSNRSPQSVFETGIKAYISAILEDGK